MNEANGVVGIDIAKAKLDVAFSDRETQWVVDNEAAALKALGLPAQGGGTSAHRDGSQWRV